MILLRSMLFLVLVCVMCAACGDNAGGSGSASTDAKTDEPAVESFEGVAATLKLVDNSRLKGTMLTQSITVDTSGTVTKVAVNLLRSIDFDPGADWARLKFVDGSVLAGSIQNASFKVDSVLGQNDVPTEKIRKVFLGVVGPFSESLVDSLVLYLPFDDPENPTADLSGRGNHGTAMNGAKYVPDGKSNGAFEFDGVDDYVDCGNDASFDLPNQITVMAWAKLDIWEGFGGTICGKGASNNESWSMDTFKDRFRFFRWHELDSDGKRTGWKDSHPLDEIVAGEWVHLAGVTDGKMVRLYINGVEKVAEKPGMQPYRNKFLVNDQPVSIGARPRQVEGVFDLAVGGLIDEVMIFNRGLSAEEIADLYESQE